jgi:hypothetical protein
MIDLFGTPTPKSCTWWNAIGCRLQRRENAMQRGTKENRPAGGPYDSDYKDKYLQVDFTIEDRGAFTMPWTAVMIYLRDRGDFPEIVCAENSFAFHNRSSDLPHADRPDF